MSFIRYAVIVLSLLSFAAVAQAASFDCKSASTKVEKLICSDQRLSNSDEELMSVYTEAMKKTGDPETLRNEQREWLKKFRNKCENISCLKNSYYKRIGKLTSENKVEFYPSTKVPGDEKVCRSIRKEIETKGPKKFGLFQGQKFKHLCGYESTSGYGSTKCEGSDDEIPINKLIEKGLDLSKEYPSLLDDYYSVYVREIDINNDGLLDFWLYTSSGTLHCERNYFFLRTKEGTYITQTYHDEFDGLTTEGGFCGGDYLAARRIHGLTYLVDVSEGKTVLFLPQPSGKLRKICSFKPRWTKIQKNIQKYIQP